MNFHVITIFPESFGSYINESIIGRAIKKKLISVKFYNPRDFVKAKNRNNYRPADGRPYGGGPGMVLRPEPILKAVEKALAGKANKKQKPLVVNFIPGAKKFVTAEAKKIARKYKEVVLISGRYEGIDARVDKILKTKKYSIGDYVLTGGELPAMVFIDCVSRQIPGVLGKHESLEEERVSSSEVYTRPEVLKWKGRNYKVPKVLLSGNHAKIEKWKKIKPARFANQ